MSSRREDDPGDDRLAELAALADGSLASERRAELEARVAESPELAERLAEQQRAVALLRSAAAQVEAPASLRARIDAEQRGRQRARPRRFALVASAAAAAAAIVLAVVVIGSGTSAESFQAALGSTALVPGAKGDATLTKTSGGWRVQIDVSGLPRLDNERFYEAWLRNPAGVLVPIGTFNQGPRVTLWSGVSPKKGFTTLTVTRERADGDQASSGQKVLVGKVDTGSG